MAEREIRNPWKTTLSEAAKRGDYILKVASNMGFSIGDRIRIGDDSLCEDHVVNGMGSLSICPATFRGDYDVGQPVIVVHDGDSGDPTNETAVERPDTSGIINITSTWIYCSQSPF